MSQLRDVSLEDKFILRRGTIFINGTQALARIALLQKELDAKEGLNTQGYISGYRGSPLGMLDMTLAQQKKSLNEADVVFQPGLNEDLAATAIWGTQQLDFFPSPKVDGVYAMWYGKGPGVDRSGDVIRHGNTAGSHKNGGVLLVMGDDHPGKSSTVVNQSEPLLSTLNVPVLYPSNVQEIIEFGLMGWQLSRYSGLWVGLKTVNETVEQTQTVDINFQSFAVEKPERDTEQEVNITRGAFNPQMNEVTVKRVRIPLVHKFVQANNLNKRIGDGKGKIGIITAGKSYEDFLQALQLLNLSKNDLSTMGLGIFKVACIWPLDPEGIKTFAQDFEELFVIEEKTPMLEPQAKEILFNLEKRPRIVGKHDPNGNLILPSDVQITPLMIVDALVSRLKAVGLLSEALNNRYQKIVSDHALSEQGGMISPSGMRMPYFCSGCPHNTSTKLPDGSLAMAGIGCHAMAIMKSPQTLPPVHMGGEGLNWVGAAPFSHTKHMFQNIGDGTYFHSGILAIRAAVAAKTNITYKILYNDAVAMTGGQAHDVAISPYTIVKQVLNEGVEKVIFVSDQADMHRQSGKVPAGVEIFHRDDLEYVQTQLREIPGVTAILYEQTCAAEKRRRRKRGLLPDPDKRLFINEAVCENCGDCSIQSTCVSIQPKQTALGVKRSIDQSSCNKDYACVKGFCPSFVSVVGAKLKKNASIETDPRIFEKLPEPSVFKTDTGKTAIMIAGIGGTGVITVGAVIGMAAHLEGKYCSIYDMTGLSQKNGAVYSHLQVAEHSSQLAAQRIGAGEANLVLGFDLIAAITGDSGITFNPKQTVFLGNSNVSPTSAFQFNRNFSIQEKVFHEQLQSRLTNDNKHLIDATTIANKLCGDTIASNMFVVGYALQKGLLPIGLKAILKAIELNRVAIEFNKKALNLGRLYAYSPKVVEDMLCPVQSVSLTESLQDIIKRQQQLLTDYQNEKYAQDYLESIQILSNAEKQHSLVGQPLTMAAATYLGKLMAYKDEYEVARLYSSEQFQRQLEEQFEPGYTLKFNLAPPLFSRKDKLSGIPKKTEFGQWMMLGFKVLSCLKALRATPFDIFSYTDERKMERKLIQDYLDDMRLVVNIIASNPSIEQQQNLYQLLSLPSEIRGFGHVKEKAVKEYYVKRAELHQSFKTQIKEGVCQTS